MKKDQFEALKNMQRVYEDTYNRLWNESKGKSPIRVVQHQNPMDDSSPVVKTYCQDGNFFLCGFTSLYFSPVGNAGLKPALKKLGYEVSKRYYGGCYFYMKEIGNRGNGDFQQQESAYHEVSAFLGRAGFNVHVDSRLD